MQSRSESLTPSKELKSHYKMISNELLSSILSVSNLLKHLKM